MAERRAAVAVAATTLWISPESHRPVDRAIVRDEADAAAWAAALDRPARLDLHGRILSQLVLGEPVVVLAENEGWAEVCAPWQPSESDPRGYRGWVRSAHLGDPMPATGLIATVTVPSTMLVTADRAVAVSWATRLPVFESAGPRIEVALPGGVTGLLDPVDVSIRSASAAPPELDPLAPVRSARQFVGLDYLWGGTTGWGLDCSGLVHQAFRSHGVRMPRDAADQQRACEPVDLAGVRPGDLYFFGKDNRITHVGFATSSGSQETRTMLHAPEESRYVEDVALAPERLSGLVSAGRVTNLTWLPDGNSF
jgi:gamma-D-glutamyl-L-lysine dipeptidyl-peptidase